MIMSLISRGLKLSHLRLIAELSKSGQVGVTAARLNITQSAASRLLSEVEQIVGAAVRVKDGRGVMLTELGVALAKRAERVLLELDDTEQELSELTSGAAGHVRIGSVTGPAVEWVLPALHVALGDMPNVTFDVEVGPSDIICDMLVSGEIDLAIARVTEVTDAAQLDQRVIATEPMSLIVRKGHPLIKTVSITPESVTNFDWVLPAKGSVLRRAVEARLSELGLSELTVRISTSAIPLTLAHVKSSDAIAPLANSLCDMFGHGDFAVLPLELGIDAGGFSLLTRRNTDPTPAAAKVQEIILNRL
jgi:DNA-binding transcriptional LysR family regulator